MAIREQFQTVVSTFTDNRPLIGSTVKFGAGDTISSAIKCGEISPTGMYLPANWTSGTITFYTSKSPNGPFLLSTNFDGTDTLSVTAAASRRIPLNPAIFNSAPYLQLVSSIAQASAVSVDFELAPIFQGIHG